MNLEWYVSAPLLATGLILFLATGLPIAFCLILLCGVVLTIGTGFTNFINVCGLVVSNTLESFILASAPLFILMAYFLHYSGIGGDAFEVLSRWLRFMRGGLLVATIGASAIFAALSGSSAASSTTIGLIALPEMFERGIDRRLATGAVAAGGTMAHLIPPSVLMIIYAMYAEVSVGKMFMAGIIPGIIMTILYSCMIAILVWRNPQLAPAVPAVTLRERLKVLIRLLPALALILLVLGVIFSGAATPTEAAGIGAFGALIIALAMRRLSLANFKESVIKTAQVTCFVLFIVAGGKLLAYALAYLTLPQQILELFVKAAVEPWQAMLLIVVAYLIMGCFLEGASLAVVTLPVVLPLVTYLQWDLIWFGILLVILLETSMITPPVGFNLYIVQGISGVSLADVSRGSAYFVAANIVILAILAAFPILSLWIPSFMR